VLPFLTKLYPRAKVRRADAPSVAVLSSYAESFFYGDYAVA